MKWLCDYHGAIIALNIILICITIVKNQEVLFWLLLKEKDI